MRLYLAPLKLTLGVNPLFFALFAAAAAAGYRMEFAIAAVCAAIHEGAHIAAGLAAGIRPSRVDIGVFGLGAEIRGTEFLSLAARCAVYMSGPAASLLLALWAGWQGYSFMFHMNAVFFVFNLIPARTLDGGHFVCGLLSRKLGVARASRFMRYMDAAVCTVLAAAGVILAVLFPYNLGLWCLAHYLRQQGKNEAAAARIRFIRAVTYGGEKYHSGRIFPVRHVAVRSDFCPNELFGMLNYDVWLCFHVYDSGGNVSIMYETSLVRRFLGVDEAVSFFVVSNK